MSGRQKKGIKRGNIGRGRARSPSPAPPSSSPRQRGKKGTNIDGACVLIFHGYVTFSTNKIPRYEWY